MIFRRLSSPLGCAGCGAAGLAAAFGVSGTNLVAASEQPKASDSNKTARARRAIGEAFSNRAPATQPERFREVFGPTRLNGPGGRHIYSPYEPENSEQARIPKE